MYIFLPIKKMNIIQQQQKYMQIQQILIIGYISASHDYFHSVFPFVPSNHSFHGLNSLSFLYFQKCGVHHIDTDRLPLVCLLLVVSMLTLLTSNISLDSATNLSQLQSYQEERETFLFLWALVQSMRDGWSCGHVAVSPRNQASGSSRGVPGQGNYIWFTFFKLVTGNFPSVASSFL